MFVRLDSRQYRTPKPTYNLHVRLRSRMVLQAMGLFQEFFRAESYPGVRFALLHTT